MARNFSDWLSGYLTYTNNSESPERLHRWAGIWAIGGALRRKCFIDMGHFQWYPNFFIIFVAPPGVASKSTSADIARKLLERVPSIIFGPSAITWQSLVGEMVLAKISYKVDPHDPSPMADMRDMSAISICASELGTFFDPKNREMIDVLNDLWDGKTGSWQKKTKHSGSDSIANPWINIIGCTTPNWIAENCTNAFVGGGFASRTVFVYADSKRKLLAYPKDHQPSNQKELEDALAADLEEISKIQGEYIVTPRAKAWGEAWYSRHYHNPPQDLRGESFAGYLSRKQTQLHKVAMVVAASQHSRCEIEAGDLQRAEIWINEIEKDMPSIYGLMNRQLETIYIEELKWLIGTEKKILKRDLMRMMSVKLNLQTLQSVLMMMIECGMIMQRQEGNEIFLEWLGPPPQGRKIVV